MEHIPLEAKRVFHKAIFNTSADEKTLYIYTELETSKGFFLEEHNAETLQCVFLVCLLYAHIDEITLFVPKSLVNHIGGEVKTLLEKIFEYCTVRKDVTLASFVHNAFQKINMVPLRMGDKPKNDRWLSYGFRKTDMLPPWLNDQLKSLL